MKKIGYYCLYKEDGKVIKTVFISEEDFEEIKNKPKLQLFENLADGSYEIPFLESSSKVKKMIMIKDGQLVPGTGLFTISSTQDLPFRIFLDLEEV